MMGTRRCDSERMRCRGGRASPPLRDVVGAVLPSATLEHKVPRRLLCSMGACRRIVSNLTHSLWIAFFKGKEALVLPCALPRARRVPYVARADERDKGDRTATGCPRTVARRAKCRVRPPRTPERAGPSLALAGLLF
jgi:hypothetical protein